MVAKKKKVLVTGGAGFIGSNFVRHLYVSYPSYIIYNLDLLTYAGNQDNVADIEAQELAARKRRYHFVHGDINNQAFIDSLLAQHKFDVVVNFAAETHVDRSIISATDFLHTNVGGVRTLAEAVRARRVPKFIHISTDEVYGPVPKGASTENSVLAPSNPYAASKAAGDLILTAFARTHRIPVTIVRGSNNYGCYQYPEKIIPLAISNVLQGARIPVHGTGKQLRSWLHVVDFCRAIDMVMHKGKIGDIYNVAGEERSVLQVLKSITSILSVPHAKAISFVSDRPGQDVRYAPDASKITRELGWKRVHSFDTAMPAVVEWYTKERPWWEKIRARTEYREHYDRQSRGKWY